LAKRLLIHAAVLLPLACSSSARDDYGDRPDDALIVPEGLSVTALPGGNGVLEVSALTLSTGPRGIEIYVALRNGGDVTACNAAVSVELFDDAEQSLAAGIGGLHASHFYRLTDGSDALAACVGAGDVTMAAVTDLPSDIALEDVAHVVYWCAYFALDVVAIDGLVISPLTSVTVGAGTAYAGTLVNELDVAVSNPSVTVFPINRVGRPLGLALGSGTIEIPPGGSWAFETNRVAALGVDYVAYPAGALAN
jgi:hypothetical protein